MFKDTYRGKHILKNIKSWTHTHTRKDPKQHFQGEGTQTACLGVEAKVESMGLVISGWDGLIIQVTFPLLGFTVYIDGTHSVGHIKHDVYKIFKNQI